MIEEDSPICTIIGKVKDILFFNKELFTIICYNIRIWNWIIPIMIHNHLFSILTIHPIYILMSIDNTCRNDSDLYEITLINDDEQDPKKWYY